MVAPHDTTRDPLENGLLLNFGRISVFRITILGKRTTGDDMNKIKSALLAGLAAMLAMQAASAAADKKAEKELAPKPGVGDVLKRSKPGDWRPLDPDNTLYLELPAGRVVIEMAPDFA